MTGIVSQLEGALKAEALDVVVAVAIIAIAALIVALPGAGWHRPRFRCLVAWMARLNVGNILAALMLGQCWRLLVYGAVLAVALWLTWRRHRKDRRRVTALLSERGKAIRARLVRTMRDRTRRRPVLHPAPGGAC